jgi:hypothetical protein
VAQKHSAVKKFGVSAVARATGFSEGSVRRFADTGIVACERDSSMKRLFTQAAVDALRARAAQTTAQHRPRA